MEEANTRGTAGATGVVVALDLQPVSKMAAGADIPDLDSLQADACGPGYHYDSNQWLLLESKEHMRAASARPMSGTRWR